jgi:hypothetical protein
MQNILPGTFYFEGPGFLFEKFFHEEGFPFFKPAGRAFGI